MSRFDDMVNGLRDEMDIPENVWRGYVQTLAELPEKGGNGGIMKNYDKKFKSNASGKKAYVLKGNKIPIGAIRAIH